MKNWRMSVAVLLGVMALGIQTAKAQSLNSNKAFMLGNQNGVSVTGINSTTELFRGYLKTSSVGSILAGVSMECALWTYTSTTGTNGGGKNATSSRAAITVNVTVDGSPADPGEVVYCDRLQVVGVDFVSSTGVLTDYVTVDLFQATKNANHFNFFKGNLSPILHEVIVTATTSVECRDSSGVIACPNSVLAGYQASTAAAIGKTTLALEEFNNSN